MIDQEKIGRCCVMIAKVMEEYAKLGTNDCFEVNTHLKEAMIIVSNHLTENNQIKFADWLLRKTREEEKES